jgi:lysophospholipase
LELVSTPDNPVPPGAAVCAVRTSDGRRLRAASFSPDAPPRGTIALLQGRAEFIEKYFETISELTSRGFQVVAMDWRGQGGSERELANYRKGHIDDFQFYQRDLDALISQVMASCPQPWFALGHSMGAAILLEQAYQARPVFQRLVLTAPMIDIEGLRFPRGARFVADLLDMLGLGAMFIPGGSPAAFFECGFQRNPLTSDPRRFARNAAVLAKEPELGVGDPTIGWVNSAFRQMQRFLTPEFSQRIRTPSLIIGCGDDKIVSLRAIEKFALRLDVANLVTLEASRHEILMERDILRDQFFSAFDAFIPGTALAESKAS